MISSPSSSVLAKLSFRSAPITASTSCSATPGLNRDLPIRKIPRNGSRQQGRFICPEVSASILLAHSSTEAWSYEILLWRENIEEPFENETRQPTSMIDDGSGSGPRIRFSSRVFLFLTFIGTSTLPLWCATGVCPVPGSNGPRFFFRNIPRLDFSPFAHRPATDPSPTCESNIFRHYKPHLSSAHEGLGTLLLTLSAAE